MIYILDAIYVALSLLFMGGRIYELINYTDLETGYMSFKGIVTNPVIIVLLIVIALCCSVIIFPFKEEQHPRMKFKLGIPAFIASVFFMSGAVINILYIFQVGGFLGFDIFVILGGIALIFFSMADIKSRKIEKIPFVLVMAIPVVFCVRSLLFNVYSISNTIATQRNIAYTITFAFFMLVFKNAYAPTRHSDTALYAVSMVNFTFSGVGMLALVIGQSVAIGIQWKDFFSDMAFTIVGVLSLIIALNLNGKSKMFNLEIEDDVVVDEVEEKEKVKEVSSYETTSFFTKDIKRPEKENKDTKEVKKVVYKADK